LRLLFHRNVGGPGTGSCIELACDTQQDNPDDLVNVPYDEHEMQVRIR
jgi:hypothetical protein